MGRKRGVLGDVSECEEVEDFDYGSSVGKKNKHRFATDTSINMRLLLFTYVKQLY